MSTNGPSTLRVAVVYPDLLGTYGDGGNAVVLAQRARWRGIPAEVVAAPSDRPLPSADIYCLGGGEDGPQVQAADALREDGGLRRVVDDGAVVLAVCAGFQVVGRTFPSASGVSRTGVGLLDVETFRHTGNRMVGEVAADPYPVGDEQVVLPRLTGFENHAAATRLGTGASPLAAVAAGVGNGWGDGSEGAWAGRVVGTYLHGPVLARNPALADLLLRWALGVDELPPLDDREVEALRRERLDGASLTHGEGGRLWRRLAGSPRQ